MKHILFFLVLVISVQCFSQSNYEYRRMRERRIALKADSTITVPYGATPSIRGGGFTGPGSLFFRTTDTALYRYTGTQWLKGSGGETTYTASNGITLASNNFKLGGTLIENTSLATGAFYLNITTSTAGVNPLAVSANDSYAIDAASTSNAAINATGLVGLIANSSGNSGITINASSGATPLKSFGDGGANILLQSTYASTNTTETMIDMLRGSSGTAANGIASKFKYEIQGDDGLFYESNGLISKLTNADGPSNITSQFIITGVNSGSSLNLISWGGQGAPQYTVNTVSVTTNTLTINSKYVQVFTGSSGTTWTLPAIGNTGLTYIIKNRGTAAITLNSNAGGNDIYTGSAVATLTINPGESYILSDDGTYFIIY